MSVVRNTTTEVSSGFPSSSPVGVVGRTVMVTGGAGFIGTHLVLRLLTAGARVGVLDDFSTGSARNLDAACDLGLDRADVVECDVRSPACAEHLGRWKPDVVVHLAAQTSLPAARRCPVADADVNIRGTLTVLDACVRHGVPRLVYAASCAIYGQVGPAALPVTEEQPLAPATPYGVSKATALRYVQWFAEHHGLGYSAAVLGNVYGPGQPGHGEGVVACMAREILAGRPPVIRGSGRQSRDFLYVRDAVQALAAMCAGPDVGMVNVASGWETSITGVHQLVCAATGTSLSARQVSLVPEETRRMLLDITRARRCLGWEPSTPLAEGITETVQALSVQAPSVGVGHRQALS
jgi:UDP-glucose 4-epimerase